MRPNRVTLEAAAATLGVANLEYPAARQITERYRLAAEDLLDQVIDGESPNGGTVERRQLCSVAARIGGKNRFFLGDELDALSELSGVGPALVELCGPSPERVQTLPGMQLVLSGNGRRTAKVLCQDLSYSDALGGPVSVNELWREITIEVAHDDWRKAASRRLLQVVVKSAELFPDPTLWRAEIDAQLAQAAVA